MNTKMKQDFINLLKNDASFRHEIINLIGDELLSNISVETSPVNPSDYDNEEYETTLSFVDISKLDTLNEMRAETNKLVVDSFSYIVKTLKDRVVKKTSTKKLYFKLVEREYKKVEGDLVNTLEDYKSLVEKLHFKILTEMERNKDMKLHELLESEDFK